MIYICNPYLIVLDQWITSYGPEQCQKPLSSQDLEIHTFQPEGVVFCFRAMDYYLDSPVYYFDLNNIF